MAAISMDGNALRDETVAGLAIRIADLGSPEICLATVLVGDDGPSRRYVERKAQEGGSRPAWCPAIVDLPATATQREVEASGSGARLKIRRCTAFSCSYLCLTGLDPEPVLDLVPAEKDVDGLTERSMGRLVRGRPGLVSCTPLGVMRLLEKYESARPSGQRAVVIGRSTLVGLPLSLLLNRKGVDATVTMAHSRTADMAAVVREADIVVGAAGQARNDHCGHDQAGRCRHRCRRLADRGRHRR